MIPFTPFQSKIVKMLLNNIDTDQIIPARFLKTTSKEGLDKQLFNDWRYLPDGTEDPNFILNKPEGRNRQILLAGDNFGCGSSREHAPWALTQFGFRAVVSTGFADIFTANSLKNSLLTIIVSPEVHAELTALSDEASLSVDLRTQTVSFPDHTKIEFPIDPFSKTCMLDGVDELGWILKQEAAITSYEHAHPR